MKTVQSKELFISSLKEHANGSDNKVFSRSEIMKIISTKGLSYPTWYFNDEANKVSRGMYKIPDTLLEPQNQEVAEVENITSIATKLKIKNLETSLSQDNLIPEVYSNYVPFGNFKDIYKIVVSGNFFPVMITGHSGNGKTMSVEQACAKANRKFVVVSMTPETDEGDLFGNYVLIDGQMVWRDGPVTIAAKEGAVLCLDEMDYGAQNLTSLQRVLEGKPFLLKKKNEYVYPQKGFTVVATMNTKGKGSEDGRYIYTNILNEAFLDRFISTFEQSFPPMRIEQKILEGELKLVGVKDDDFAEKLCQWADAIRKTFLLDGCNEVITTRRLVHIVKTYGVFRDKLKSIELCLKRFDDDTKLSFLDLYTKMDSSVEMSENSLNSESDNNLSA